MYRSKYILASKFFELYDREDLQHFYNLGIFPINDVFKPLFTEDFDIALLYGGRGSGKSDSVTLHLIEECMNEKYFMCLYGRDVYKRIRTSIHKGIVEAIEMLGYQEEFIYGKLPNSSLDIIHKSTGNSFIAIGGDNPDSLKSISDPTHIYLEEADQFREEAFTQLGPTLRTIRGKNRMYLLFNTEKVTKTHWLWKTFFTDENKSKKKILKIFSIYTDNYFINQAEYYETLRVNSVGNQHQLEAAANGAWGVQLNKNPFFYAFDYNEHTSDLSDYEFSGTSYIDLSFDFNHTPMTIVVGQFDMGSKCLVILDHIESPEVLRNITPIEYVCMEFKRKYIDSGKVLLSHLRITGDASGTARKADRKFTENFYTDIMQTLGVKRSQIHIPKANPMHKQSYLVINYMLNELRRGEFLVDRSLEILIDDINKAYPNEKYSLDPAKKEFGLHALDAFRYLQHLWFPQLKYKRIVKYLKKVEANQD